MGAQDGVESVGDGEDDVVILDGQQVSLLRRDPAELLRALTLGTVPVPARVVVDLAVAATVAVLDVAAESGGATA
jgi:hypothetical protein